MNFLALVGDNLEGDHILSGPTLGGPGTGNTIAGALLGSPVEKVGTILPLPCQNLCCFSISLFSLYIAGLRPFRCDCGARFNSRAVLNNHKLMHLGEYKHLLLEPFGNFRYMIWSSPALGVTVRKSFLSSHFLHLSVCQYLSLLALSQLNRFAYRAKNWNRDWPWWSLGWDY